MNPLEYEVNMSIPELVELVLKNHTPPSASQHQPKGGDQKGDAKETVERSSGE